MNSNPIRPATFVGLVLSAALLPVLIGCASDSDHRGGHRHATSGYVRTEIQVEDDYVYYPDYEVYYSSNRHMFVYRDGRNWVARSAPPRVGIDVVLSSPSVRVEYRDAPAHHHDEIVRRYPRHWRPRDDDRHDNRRDHRDNDRSRD